MYGARENLGLLWSHYRELIRGTLPLPADLITHRDPVGPENDRYTIKRAHIVVAMWGNHGLKPYSLAMRRISTYCLRDDWQCVGITKYEARHPLYVAKSSILLSFPDGLC